MRSIVVRILLWFLATLIVCLAGSSVTSELRNRFGPGRRDVMSRMFSFQLGGARHAYETSGKAGLKQYFDRLNEFLPGNYALVDAHGIDLLTGQNLSEQLRQAGPPHRDLLRMPARLRMAWPDKDRKYTLFIDAQRPGGPWSPIPYYIWITVAASGFCYILAVQLASPLRILEQTVVRFGRGDLGVRAEMKRTDEFGKLAQSFNVMADRIELLLTAERRLLQDVSHELRSPLARLEFAVELARTSPDQNKSLDRIKKEVARLSTLVSELLQVTRAESDPDSRNVDEIALPLLLQDVVDDGGVESQARHSEVHLSPCNELVVKGDRELLRRAVENVVRNAIRYAPAGSSVEVGLERSADMALISIRDYGPGVPDESLISLFRPFFRVEADRSRNNGGGVGLGLSIAQRAVSVHKGTISARNARPGLLVEIRLPLVASENVGGQHPVGQVETGTAGPF